MADYNRSHARHVARCYAMRFPDGETLAERVAYLLATYGDLPAGSWISWEGASLTQCETPAGLRRLLAALEQIGKEGAA